MLSDYGFVRVAAASPRVRVADVDYHVARIRSLMKEAASRQIAAVVFPELSLTGYTCGDLLLQPALTRAAEEGLMQLLACAGPAIAIVGLPVMAGGRLFNCAAVIGQGTLLGVVPKLHIPDSREFCERRWFAPGTLAPKTVRLCGREVPMGCDLVFESERFSFAIEICEDMWSPNPPSGRLAQMGAQILFNPSASNETVAKHPYRRGLIAMQSGRCIAGYVYAGAGTGESTTDLVFGGYTAVYENGTALAEGARFSQDDVLTAADVDVGRLLYLRSRNAGFFEGNTEPGRRIPFEAADASDGTLLRAIAPHPFVPGEAEREQRLREIVSIQTAGLRKRLEHIGTRVCAIAVSGGLDSALALLVAAHTFRQAGWDPAGVHALMMPGPGTTGRTERNAHALTAALGATGVTIPIGPALDQHFSDIGQDPDNYDITYENSQARERYQILMDYANRVGGIALGTGDLSELALGWCTFSGDHISMYNVNGGVPKTLVRHLTAWLAGKFGEDAAGIVRDIHDTPISPELIPSDGGRIAQRTEDILGAYELHDFFLYHMIEGGAPPSKLRYLARIAFAGKYADADIDRTLQTFLTRFFSQQYKRSCLPDGPKVGTVSLSPRGDWRMPSDASPAVWLRDSK
ncbi:MAG: NAD(+) synthase [Christensenellales bacterium]|jgi:NAD+ synthase (glutamine-hydrolysing)